MNENWLRICRIPLAKKRPNLREKLLRSQLTTMSRDQGSIL
jgi:hypothetical protein